MKVFFDTNLLVYRIDTRFPEKREIARRLFDAALLEGSALISTQSLQEFYNVATGKLGLSQALASKVANEYAQAQVVTLSPPLLCAAMARDAAARWSFWDALIVEAALAGGAKILYSEDMGDGDEIDGLLIRNPFRDA